MKHAKIRPCIIARVIVLCMMCSQLFSILSYAENSVTTLQVGGQSTQLSVQPKETDLGTMIEAKKITGAFDMQYSYNAETQSVTITDQTHGQVVFVHNATTYSKNGSTYSCKPYFYIENTIPMIELGFFCDIFEISYQYDKAKNTIYAERTPVNLSRTLLAATATEDITSDPMTFWINKDLSANVANLAGADVNNSFSNANRLLIQPGGYLEYYVNTETTKSYRLTFISGVNTTYGSPTLDVFVNGSKTISNAALQTDVSFDFRKNNVVGNIVLKPGKNTIKFQPSGGVLVAYGFTLSAADAERFPLNLNGTLSVEASAKIPSNGLGVTLYLEDATDIYHDNLISDEIYELGTVRLTKTTPVLSFSYSTKQSVANASYYSLLYRVNDAQDSVVATGFVNTNGGIQGVELLDQHYGTPMRFSSNDITSVDISIPAFTYQPCGTDSYWTFDADTGTLDIKGTGSVTDNGWKLLSEYITTVNVHPGISSFSTQMPMKLQQLYLPDTITEIGDRAFAYCDSLSTVTYSGSQAEWAAVSIGSNNNSLTSKTVTCTNSNKVSVIYYNNGGSGSPESIEVTNNMAVTISSVVPVRENYEFLGWATSPTATTANYRAGNSVNVGSSNLKLYAVWDYATIESGQCGANLNWSFYSNGLLEITGSGAIYDYSDLRDIPWYGIRADVTSLSLSSSITHIGDYAFHNFYNLTNVTIPNGVTSIGDYAFYQCHGLTSISIPGSVTNIGDYAFGYCDSLTSISIPNSVTSIGTYVFGSCSGLTSISIPNGVTSIGVSAFEDCHSLTSVTIPDSVTSIGNYAFRRCEDLTSVAISNSITSIGDHVFDGCSSLPFIAIPNNVTSIGVSAFDSCSSLQSVAIPNSVTNIDDAAFYNCRSMANIYYAGTLNEWSTVTVDINNAALDIATLHYDSYISVNSASCSADVGQIVAKVDFDYVMKGARLYLAVYDDAGKRLLEAKMTDITPGDTTATITIPTNKSYVGYSYKIMLWDPTSLAPYITYFDGSIPPRN